MSLPKNDDEHASLVDAAAAAERRNYAVAMAAAFKSLTSAEQPTAAEITETKQAAAEWQSASKALTEYEAHHP